MEAPPDALARREGEGPSVAVRAMKDISFGSIAGMVSKVFEHPFDLTKVRLQSQVLDATARFNGPLDCLTQTWKKEGIRGLYRGLPAPIVGAMAENASLFLSYNEIQNLMRKVNAKPLEEQFTLGELAVAAAGAGAITSFFLTPIELVKCKMQVQMLMSPALLHPTSPPPSLASATSTASFSSSATTAPRLPPQTSPTPKPKLPGPIQVLTSVLRTSGFKGLWLGQTGTLIRETGGGAAWFVSKEAVARLLVSLRPDSHPSSHSPSFPHSHSSTNHKPDLTTWESALSGASAGIAYNIALFPADTVKSAMQTEAELRPKSLGAGETKGSGPTFLGTAKAMWKAGGVRGLYAGCGITVARAVPSSALIFIIYDGLKQRFG